MRTILLSFSLFLSALFSFQAKSQAPMQYRIKFEDISLDKALKKAAQARKPVFVNCYSPLSEPCRLLDSIVFPQKKVADFYNANFICVKMNMEKGKNLSMSFRYDVKLYPTFLFLDAAGKVFHREVGACNADEMLALGKEALDSTKNLKAITQKISNGDNSFEVIESALRSNIGNQKKNNSLLDLYFNNLRLRFWFNSQSWALLSNYAPLDSKYGKFVLWNRHLYGKTYGNDQVFGVIGSKVIDFCEDLKSEGFTNERICTYLNSLVNPVVLKMRDLILSNVFNTENWSAYIMLLETCPTYVDNGFYFDYQQFGEEFFTLKNEGKIEKLCDTLRRMKQPMAVKISNELMILKFTAILKGGNLNQESKELSPLSKAMIEKIVTETWPLLDSCSFSKRHANNLAWNMIRHPDRKRFLHLAKALSKYAISGNDNFYFLHTYAAVCAQMGQFDEAVNYQRKAVDIVQEEYPEESDYYTEWLKKFKNKKTVF